LYGVGEAAQGGATAQATVQFATGTGENAYSPDDLQRFFAEFAPVRSLLQMPLHSFASTCWLLGGLGGFVVGFLVSGCMVGYNMLAFAAVALIVSLSAVLCFRSANQTVSRQVGGNDPRHPGKEGSLDIQYLMGVAGHASTW
jgi:hypothetical protein